MVRKDTLHGTLEFCWVHPAWRSSSSVFVACCITGVSLLLSAECFLLLLLLVVVVVVVHIMCFLLCCAAAQITCAVLLLLLLGLLELLLQMLLLLLQQQGLHLSVTQLQVLLLFAGLMLIVQGMQRHHQVSKRDVICAFTARWPVTSNFVCPLADRPAWVLVRIRLLLQDTNCSCSGQFERAVKTGRVDGFGAAVHDARM
jgi:hypothetical protein